MIKEFMEKRAVHIMQFKAEYKEKLDLVLTIKTGPMSLETFRDTIYGLYVNIYYNNDKEINFVIGDKVFKMEFEKDVLKEFNTKLGGNYHMFNSIDKRYKNKFYIDPCTVRTPATMLNTKEIKITVIDAKDAGIEPDKYYGGLYLLKQYYENLDPINTNQPEIQNEDEIKTSKVIQVKNSEVTIDVFDMFTYAHEPISISTKEISEEIIVNCINIINFAYSTTIKNVLYAGNVHNANSDRFLFTICILSDSDCTYIITIKNNGEINTKIEVISTPEDAVIDSHLKFSIIDDALFNNFYKKSKNKYANYNGYGKGSIFGGNQNDGK